MKRSETWVCDVCGKEQTGECFPKEWYQVVIESGFKYHGLGNNTDIERDCCSKSCIKRAIEPLLKESY